MQYIKARYLKDGNPTGREYTFKAKGSIRVGDKVSIEPATAIVTQADVPEEEVALFRDRLREIDGKVLSDDEILKFREEAEKGLDPGDSKEFTCPLCGGNAYAEIVRENEHLHAICHKCGFKVME